ncbi:MAG: HypC/HybG/HupF family hydrogenase formation chaperone [Chloroflexi bacterium]|nr:HypC/HybG/HupF family hydrogenase formation chaperone [Chloroflexota bacterium]
MCLAVPVQVVSVEGNEAEVDIGGVKRKVSITLTPDARVGDYVLLHTGYAISVIDQAEAQETLGEAQETLRLLTDMITLGDAAEAGKA